MTTPHHIAVHLAVLPPRACPHRPDPPLLLSTHPHMVCCTRRRDFGRCHPSLASVLGAERTEIIQLDVAEVHMENWP